MGRMEILTGVERRRDWSDEKKLSILQEAAEPDTKIADVTRRHDIKPQQIYTWRRKFAAEQAEPLVSFLPVALIATASSDEVERPAPVDKQRWLGLSEQFGRFTKWISALIMPPPSLASAR